MAKKIKANYFNEDYWTKGNKSGYTVYSFFRGDHIHQEKATLLNELYGPEKILIAGCARGWTVDELSKLGVDSYGFDISKWAIKHSPESTNRRLVATDGMKATTYNEGMFDVVASFEVAEHVHSSDVPVWLANQYSWLGVGGKLFATICTGNNDVRGIEDNDESHQTLRDREWWEERFNEAGFVWDQESFEKSRIVEAGTKENGVNVAVRMGWHVFTWSKP